MLAKLLLLLCIVILTPIKSIGIKEKKNHKYLKLQKCLILIKIYCIIISVTITIGF